MHYNPRTWLVVTEELCKLTPLGFAWEAEEFVSRQMLDGEEKYTVVQQFLRCMKQLSIVLLQDAAAIISLYPDRREHPLFHLDSFQQYEFQVRCNYSFGISVFFSLSHCLIIFQDLI